MQKLNGWNRCYRPFGWVFFICSNTKHREFGIIVSGSLHFSVYFWWFTIILGPDYYKKMK